MSDKHLTLAQAYDKHLTLAQAIVPFPPALVERVDAGGGRQADYVAVHHVIQRLLAEHGAFSWRVDSITQLGEDEHAMVVVAGTLKLIIDEEFHECSAVGSERLLKQKRDGGLFVVENAAETAEASALKRAASKFGIGLHLWAQEGYWLRRARRFAPDAVADEMEPEQHDS